MNITSSKRIRPGLYLVALNTGETFNVENRYSEFGTTGEWLWYVTSNDRSLWLDPTYTKRDAMTLIENIGQHEPHWL